MISKKHRGVFLQAPSSVPPPLRALPAFGTGRVRQEGGSRPAAEATGIVPDNTILIIMDTINRVPYT